MDIIKFKKIKGSNSPQLFLLKKKGDTWISNVLEKNKVIGYPHSPQMYTYIYDKNTNKTINMSGKTDDEINEYVKKGGQLTKSIKIKLSTDSGDFQMDLGFGWMAKNLISNLASVSDMELGEKFLFSFFQNESGYYACKVIRLKTKKELSWFITSEERSTLIEKTVKKDGTVITDTFAFDNRIIELTKELYNRFPIPESSSYIDDGLEDGLSIFYSKNQNNNIEQEEIAIEDIPF